MRDYEIFGIILMVGALFQAACIAQNKIEIGSVEPDKLSEMSAETDSKDKTPVLVELFTSEGCSSCPSADRALAFLEKEQPTYGAEVITLALHVNYWDYLGWKDPFATELFTQRQTIYGQKFGLSSVYTPQMVVDGSVEFTGSDLAKAQKAIGEARKSRKADIELSVSGDSLKVVVSAIPDHKDASVYLAITEDNLATDVRRGENSGKKLDHMSVVRELRSLGMIKPEESTFTSETTISKNPAWKSENVKLIVFVQENVSRRIFGVKRLIAK